MLGVLLQRKPAHFEIVNDTSGNVCNWWTQIRDNPEEMARLIELTPDSKENFNNAVEIITGGEGTDIKKAWAFFVVIHQSYLHSLTDAHWRRTLGVAPGSKGTWKAKEIYALAKRLKKVQIENTDALEVLKFTADCADAVVYCDPPYHTADTTPYGDFTLDTDKMRGLLLAQKGSVAVSGYGAEWDCLGWRKVEHKTAFRHGVAGKKSSPRTEVLWMNYDLTNTQFPLFSEN